MKKKYEEITIFLTLIYIMISPLYFNYSNLFAETSEVTRYVKIFWITITLFISLGYLFVYRDSKVKFNRLDFLIIIFPILYFIPILCGKNVESIRLNLEYIFVSLLLAVHIIVLRRILNKKRLEYILKTIVLSCVISVLFSFITDSNHDITNFFQISSLFGDYYASSVDRLYGTLFYPNTYAVFVLVGFLISYNYLLKDNNKSIITHFCLFILFLAFLLTISKITTIIFLIINILMVVYYLIQKNYKQLISLLTIYFSMVLPVLYAVNKTRIFIYNNNLIIYFFIIILMFIIYYLSYIILSYINNKSKIVYIILIIIISTITCVLFLYPKSQTLKISNVTSTSSSKNNDNIIVADFMNLKPENNYIIKLDIKSKTELNNPILNLKVLYIKNEHIIKKIVSSHTVNEGTNTYYFNLNTPENFDFYYLDLQNIDMYNSVEISSVEVFDLSNNSINIYSVDYIWTPYIYLHSKEQLKYDKYSYDDRIATYKHVLELSKESFLTGQGFRALRHYSSIHYFHSLPTDEHSFIARMLMEVGIIGVIYYFLLILYGLVFSIRLLKDEKSTIAILLFLLLVGSSIVDITMSYEFIHFLLLLDLVFLNYNYRNLKNKNKVVFISSAGGHLTELLAIDSIYKNYDYVLITEKNMISKKLKNKYNVRYLLYGSRYYPIKYVFTSIVNVFKNVYYFIRYNPDVIYTTGAHTSLLICYLGYIFDRKIIFVEVFDRTHTPTLSGKLIYPIATTFVVQHNNYKEIYPEAKYIKGVY